LLTLVLTAWAASYAAWQLGLSPFLSFASGLLYSCLPFAFLRNVAHINLVYYPVPLLCLLAVVIANRGAGVRNARHAILAGLFACAIQGFDYVYDSFFAAALFGMAALISFRKDNLQRLKLPLAAIALLTICTVLNLLPGLNSWRQEGKPPEMGYKSPAEAEYYGAKIRRMIVPHQDNAIPLLAAYARRDIAANFPNENENTTARLGLYGSLGLGLMLFYLLRRPVDNIDTQPDGAVSALGLVTLLFITVGGFGAIFNLLVTPDIRAYNRFSVFLAFFLIAITGLWLTRVVSRCKPRWHPIVWSCAIAFVVLSLYDQLLDARPLLSLQAGSIQQAKVDQQVAAEMENHFPDGTAVLELPFTGYPIMYNFHKMYSYDHVRPYLWSHHLKWSWPSLSIRHYAWQEEMKALEGRALIDAAVLSGFSALWIDRYAYEDNGEHLLSSLPASDMRRVDVGSERYAVFDLRDAARRLRAELGDTEFARRARALVGPRPLANWHRGFYDEERRPDGVKFRWARHDANLELKNPGNEPLHACVQFNVVAPRGAVRLDGNKLYLNIPQGETGFPVSLTLDINPHSTHTLHFHTDAPAINAPADPRTMHFYLASFHVKTMDTDNRSNDSCASAGR
jgi:phosphoglycerol transferase